MKTKKIATYGLLVALAFILSYIETLFPIPVPIPGIKLGLANLVVTIALYSMGPREAFILSLTRIVLVGFTFGNFSNMAFSLIGGLFSWLMMTVFYKSKLFSIIGVSIIGGVAHNFGQIIVAVFINYNINIFYILPLLTISGMVTGTLTGYLAHLVVKRIKAFINVS